MIFRDDDHQGQGVVTWKWLQSIAHTWKPPGGTLRLAQMFNCCQHLRSPNEILAIHTIISWYFRMMTIKDKEMWPESGSNRSPIHEKLLVGHSFHHGCSDFSYISPHPMKLSPELHNFMSFRTDVSHWQGIVVWKLLRSIGHTSKPPIASLGEAQNIRKIDEIVIGITNRAIQCKKTPNYDHDAKLPIRE